MSLTGPGTASAATEDVERADGCCASDSSSLSVRARSLRKMAAARRRRVFARSGSSPARSGLPVALCCHLAATRYMRSARAFATASPQSLHLHVGRCARSWFSARLITVTLTSWPLHSHCRNTSTAIASVASAARTSLSVEPVAWPHRGHNLATVTGIYCQNRDAFANDSRRGPGVDRCH